MVLKFHHKKAEEQSQGDNQAKESYKYQLKGNVLKTWSIIAFIQNRKIRQMLRQLYKKRQSTIPFL